MNKIIGVATLLYSALTFSQIREIAITIDDLPLVASKMNTPGNQQRSTERFNKIIQAFSDYKVPVVGFVIGGAIEKGQWPFLEKFKEAGFMLGNHTYSHYNLNQMSAEKYIADIDRADKKLQPIMTQPKYFRYPYLAEGNKQTKQKVFDFLTANRYIVAPVTIDSKDYGFNEQLYHVPYRQREAYINKLKARYLDFIWKQTLRAEKRTNGKDAKQILLLHANLLNSYVLPDILAMYKKNGYTFITLEEALKNPAPEIRLTETQSEASENPLKQVAASLEKAFSAQVN